MRILSLLVITLFAAACNSNEGEGNVDMNTVSPAPQTVAAPTISDSAPKVSTPNAEPIALNPAHGLPGHRCDIAVGAPLNSAPNANSAPAPVQMNTAPATQNAPMMQSAPSTGGKVLINPPHGQPGHDCSVEVGKPLPVRQ
ncbi:MAG: hypothetical protein U1C70_12395 [Sediminibacterium sp.]|jgi:hypothetical protein|uniref:hypothetical protein n=1 Tax=Sediminibacterium sp. TaxID=1917865 RepID=UPI002AB9C194|nr:hypothetical protein [Sediminibacterium sp.]MDZ4072618.1 hypothetical protein [Sediminibacterium sp.]